MYQKGERRRDELIRATLRVIGSGGTGAVTHRAVAEEAGVPLSATTYYFASKEELLEQALATAAREETERLERIVLDLAPLELGPADWAAALSGHLATDIGAEFDRHVALFELGLESTRTPALGEELARWRAAHVRLAELGCRAVGSAQPELDARLVVATITGLLLEGLAAGGGPELAGELIRPVLERLFGTLATAERQPVA